jgi:hypothetical protein
VDVTGNPAAGAQCMACTLPLIKTEAARQALLGTDEVEEDA